MKKSIVIAAFAMVALVACTVKEEKIDMTWQFTKELDTANPTLNIYDMSDGTALLATVKLSDKVTTVAIKCEEGNEICYGGSFAIAGENMAIGCGENCKDYADYKAESCASCAEGTVSVSFDNFR